MGKKVKLVPMTDRIPLPIKKLVPGILILLMLMIVHIPEVMRAAETAYC
jgi:hypothetical protein